MYDSRKQQKSNSLHSLAAGAARRPPPGRGGLPGVVAATGIGPAPLRLRRRGSGRPERRGRPRGVGALNPGGRRRCGGPGCRASDSGGQASDSGDPEFAAWRWGNTPADRPPAGCQDHSPPATGISGTAHRHEYSDGSVHDPVSLGKPGDGRDGPHEHVRALARCGLSAGGFQLRQEQRAEGGGPQASETLEEEPDPPGHQGLPSPELRYPRHRQSVADLSGRSGKQRSGGPYPGQDDGGPRQCQGVGDVLA